MFLDENLQSRRKYVDNTTEFLGKQVEDAKAKLDEQDARLAAFQRRYLGSLPDQNQTNLNLLAGITSQLEGSTQAFRRAQQGKRFSESLFGQPLCSWQTTQSGVNPVTMYTPP